MPFRTSEINFIWRAQFCWTVSNLRQLNLSAVKLLQKGFASLTIRINTKEIEEQNIYLLASVDMARHEAWLCRLNFELTNTEDLKTEDSKFFVVFFKSLESLVAFIVANKQFRSTVVILVNVLTDSRLDQAREINCTFPKNFNSSRRWLNQNVAQKTLVFAMIIFCGVSAIITSHAKKKYSNFTALASQRQIRGKFYNEIL